ncbi:hypothetical protein C5L31_001561 [Secundilactobacillus malefermentans]|uniref:DUF308 domain-containing protein n=2 Tax=Secundilactobacillus malefermentans TaxID=176292 RepID=A0A4R5NTI8_9LACO|nr:hypothetical protein FD44_GL001517 [Secundilactobacillus malefermentans DSM 5705 = KCTC 3548]TDG80534.1 hypothetical protein C5L31_001561 [Secundilactobacillus malefermentans]
MLFLAIIGVILIFLSFFSLLTAVTEHAGYFWQALLLVLSLLLTSFSIWKLPYWHASDNQPATSQTSKRASSSINGNQSPTFSTSESGTNVQTQSLKEKNVLSQLQKNYKTFGTVSFDGQTRTYKVVPANSDFNKAITYLTNHPSKYKAVKWPQEVSNTVSTSKSLKKALGAGYTLNLRNKADNESLIKVKDGKLLYNKFAN